MIPLRGSDGQTSAILCVQRQIEGIVQSRWTFVRNVFLGLLLLLIPVILGQGAYLGRVILRPIKKIGDEATRFADENKPPVKRLGEAVHNSDEIGVLADSIDRMEDQVGQYIDNIQKITAGRERIAAELSLAEEIQASMLPHIFPPFPDREEFELYAAMDPARNVGGDFYDFFLVDDDHLCLVIADVSGKGIPAALFMMMSKIIVQNCALLGMSPAEVMKKTNEILCDHNETQMFVTVWLGILEISSGKMVAANAGHEYPALKRGNGHFETFRDKHGFVLGGMDGVRFSEYELKLSPGDTMFVYTDDNRLLADGIYEFIEASTSLYATLVPIRVVLHGVPEEERGAVPALIKAHYGYILQEQLRDRRANTIKTISMIAVGLVFLGIYLALALTRDDSILLEVLSVIGSFALWEATDSYLLERRSIKRDMLKTAQFLTMEVAFED